MKLYLPISKVFLFFLVLLLIVSVCKSNAAVSNFKIIGKTKDLNGERVVLYYGDKNGNLKVDTAIVNEDSFLFTGEILHSVWMQIELLSNEAVSQKQSRFFFVDPGVVYVEFSLKSFYSPKVIGSKTDSSYGVFYFQQDTLNKKINVISDSLGKVNKTNYHLLETELSALERLGKDNSIRFIKQNANTAAAAFELMINMYEWDDSTLQSLYPALDEDVKQTVYGKLVDKRLQVSWGMTAPDFEAISFDSLQFSLTQQLKSSKLVMLVFWASWCKPCREEVPYLKMLKKEFGTSGLEIVAIANDGKSVDRWSKAIREDESYQFIHLMQNSGHPTDIGDLYSVKPIPTLIMINGKGEIIYRKTGGPYNDLLNIISSILNKD